MQAPQLEEFLCTLPDISGKNIYVWGIGDTANLHQESFAREASLNICGYTVSKGYEVSDYTYWGGGQIYGKKLFSPEEVAADPNAFVIICSYGSTETYRKISSEINSLSLKYCTVDAAIFSLHKKELRKVFTSLDDDRSREIYLSLLWHRVKGEYIIDDCTSWDHSFVNPAFQRAYADDVFVDCGAFVGDTIEKFIWQHDGFAKKIIAFEPDAKNRLALEKRVRRLNEEWNFSPDKITVYPYGVSDKSSVSYLRRHCDIGSDSSIASEPDDKTQEIKVVAIDDILPEGYTFLKADIESYEYKMLLGAEKTIKKYKPRLAICIYHNATDFYSIPLLVKEFRPDYKLMIRHHSLKITETLLYAW